MLLINKLLFSGSLLICLILFHSTEARSGLRIRIVSKYVSSNIDDAVCTVFSREYPNELLYVKGGAGIKNQGLLSHEISTVPVDFNTLNFSAVDNRSLWQFVPLSIDDELSFTLGNVGSGSNIRKEEDGDPDETMYVLRNLANSEYLYASKTPVSCLLPLCLNMRRRIFVSQTVLVDEEYGVDTAFMWYVRPRANNSALREIHAGHVGDYQLWNVRYKEPLFAAPNSSKKDARHRVVYTYNKKPENKKSFVWLMKCKSPAK
jgi:hypothetical protein